MNIFALLPLIPMLFKTAIDISKLFDGTATEEEWTEVINDVGNTVMQVPELKGFVVMIEGAVKVLELAIPMLMAQNEAAKATQGLMSASLAVSEEELNKSRVALRLMSGVAEKVNAEITEHEVADGDFDARALFKNFEFDRP